MTTTEVTDTQWRDLQLAHHEAGHAVADVLLLGRVDAVTIAGHGAFAGLTLGSRACEDLAAILDRGRDSSDGQAASVRARDLVEREAMVYLAGPIAEDLASLFQRWSELVATSEDPDVALVARATRATVARAPVTPAVTQAIEESYGALQQLKDESPTADETTDESRAWRRVVALNPSRDARVLATHEAYLRAAIRSLLEREWAAVEALALALVEHRTLSGDAATLIVMRNRAA